MFQSWQTTHMVPVSLSLFLFLSSNNFLKQYGAGGAGDACGYPATALPLEPCPQPFLL
jgi:hypothetical protein